MTPAVRSSVAESLAEAGASGRLLAVCDEVAAGGLVGDLRRRLPSRKAALVGLAGPAIDRVELDLIVALVRAGYAVVAASRAYSPADQARQLAALLFAEDLTVVAVPATGIAAG